MAESSSGSKFIWTRWGTLVFCDRDGKLKHGDALKAARNVFISAAGHLISPEQSGEPVALIKLGPCLSNISRDGIYYTAEPDGNLSCTRSACGIWEQFLLLAPSELEAVIALRANDWVLRDATIITGRDVHYEAGFGVKFGPLRIDLTAPGTIRITERAGQNIAAVNLIHAGWQVTTARRFHPLIYFTVFGPDHIFEMLLLCLTSIAKFGAYTGDILILSDREPERMGGYIPAALTGRTSFSYREVTSHTSMMMQRFDISALPIEEFQPVLCLDADMICDAPLMPMFAACNTTAKFSGSAEYGGVTIGQMSEGIGNWFGRFLFVAAGESFAHAKGLNGGAIVFPHKQPAMAVFDLVASAFAKSVQNFPDFKGMGEQPILNYVLQGLSLIDADGLNEFIQFRNQCLGTQERRGLMHFNYSVGGNKIADMREYSELIGKN
jgi:hypothetical protein